MGSVYALLFCFMNILLLILFINDIQYKSATQVKMLKVSNARNIKFKKSCQLKYTPKQETWVKQV